MALSPNRTVVKKVDGEWQVRVYINGKFAEGPTYYAADKEDALATQLAMRGELEREHGVRFDGLSALEPKGFVVVKSSRAYDGGVGYDGPTCREAAEFHGVSIHCPTIYKTKAAASKVARLLAAWNPVGFTVHKYREYDGPMLGGLLNGCRD